jgi:uncharacterized protein (DUF486 family)
MVRTSQILESSAHLRDPCELGIAFFEYCFQVPGNRIGYGALTLMQLKIVQEIITLSVFIIFAFVVFGQAPKWNYAVSAALMVGAVYFAFRV